MTTPEQSEASFQRAIIDLARHQGYLVFHAHDSRRQVRPGVHVGDRDAAGWPDLVLCRAPRLIIAELKAEKGRLTAAQQAWIDALSGCYSIEVYVWRTSMWDEIRRLLSPAQTPERVDQAAA